ncbi:WD40/YVTN/BNR-like repeat-containing protein [Paenibacillus sp. SAF-054]|uniref:WD40/YVTN/BNR-like repeat-containing protein n=1 Tax=unclassified Paenibacillus TaxID=185978 RepID=UPI003F7F5833
MKWTKKLASLTVLFSVLLSACSSHDEQNVLPESAPAAQDTTDSVADLGQTLTVVAPDTAKKNTKDTGKYQIQTKLTDFQLLTETKGIAWGLTRNELRMYLTDDNGQTWVNISPSANVQFPANPRYGKDIYFTDPNHGWIVRDPSGLAETIVLHTSDGGESWDISSIAQKNKISAITFDSPDRGWLMATEDSTTGKEMKVLYRTDDGGSLWKVVMQNTEYNPAKATVTSPIPHLGYTLGMTFVDSQRGYTMVQELGEPKMYQTLDGGNKWASGPTFFNRDKFKNCVSYTTDRPQFLDIGRKAGFIPIGCKNGNSTKYNGYFTQDGGATWNFVNFGLGSSEGMNQDIRPVFISANEGWALLGSTIYHTLDQGKTWSSVADNQVIKEKLAEYPEVVKLQFSSPLVGWILVENNEQKSSRLLQTTDGGLNWRVL